MPLFKVVKKISCTSTLGRNFFIALPTNNDILFFVCLKPNHLHLPDPMLCLFPTNTSSAGCTDVVFFLHVVKVYQCWSTWEWAWSQVSFCKTAEAILDTQRTWGSPTLTLVCRMPMKESTTGYPRIADLPSANYTNRLSTQMVSTALDPCHWK